MAMRSVFELLQAALKRVSKRERRGRDRYVPTSAMLMHALLRIRNATGFEWGSPC